MISEAVAFIAVATGAVEDWRTGQVHPVIWYVYGPLIVGASGIEYGSIIPAVVFMIWFFATGLLASQLTRLGMADVFALGIIGAGSTVYPWTSLVSIAAITAIYAGTWTVLRNDEIRLIPGLALAYIPTLIFSVM